MRSDLRSQEWRVALQERVPREGRAALTAAYPPVPQTFLLNVCSFESLKYLLAYLAFSVKQVRAMKRESSVSSVNC